MPNSDDWGARPVPSAASLERDSSAHGEGLALSEANHRIANNLALIVGLLQAQAREMRRRPGTIRTGEAARLIDEIGARVQTVAALHRLLSLGASHRAVDIAGYLREVCDALTSAMAYRGEIDVRGLASGCILAPGKATPLALIVGELVTNALKHARPASGRPRLAVAIRGGADEMVVEVADNGGGLPADLDPLTEGGTGLWLVRTLAEQLRAQLEFRSGARGLRVRVRLLLD